MGRQGKGNRNSRSDFNTPLLRSYINRQKQAAEQQELRTIYDIEDPATVIVEKKNAVAQILRTVFSAAFVIIRIAADILLIVLAITGLMAFLYPNIRAELRETVEAVISEVRGYLSFGIRN